MTEHPSQNVYRHRTSITLTVMFTLMTSKSYVYWVLLVDKRLFAGVAELENLLEDPCVSAFISPLEFGFNLGSESIYSLKTERP